MSRGFPWPICTGFLVAVRDCCSLLTPPGLGTRWRCNVSGRCSDFPRGQNRKFIYFQRSVAIRNLFQFRELVRFVQPEDMIGCLKEALFKIDEKCSSNRVDGKRAYFNRRLSRCIGWALFVSANAPRRGPTLSFPPPLCQDQVPGGGDLNVDVGLEAEEVSETCQSSE